MGTDIYLEWDEMGEGKGGYLRRKIICLDKFSQKSFG